MNMIGLLSSSRSRAAAMVLAALSCLSFVQPTVADPTRFDFTLFSIVDYGGDGQLFFDGGGSFGVADPVPASGRVVLVASDLAGTAGEAIGYLAPFGYAFGNTFEYFVGPPPEGNIAVTRTPHEDALITFQDGVAVGISYQESHTCDTGHHCQPGFTNAGSISMFDAFYYFAPGPYPLITAGPIIITREVPEPGTQALLVAGLLVLMISVDRFRRMSPQTAAAGSQRRRPILPMRTPGQ
jgi:hypothetical protein